MRLLFAAAALTAALAPHAIAAETETDPADVAALEPGEAETGGTGSISPNSAPS